MRLSWSEIRARARSFSKEWADAHYEKGETQSFYNDFFAIFGVKRRQVAVYEQRVKLLNDRRGFIDLFWPGTLIVEQKSAGLDLQTAQGQALNYYDALREDQQPRYILTCDFQRFRLLDLDTSLEVVFSLKELHKHIENFAFILGRQRTFGTQAGVNIKAAELMGKLHDALEDSGYVGHDLERLLVRLLFCLFSDDTGIFEPKDIFLSLIEIDTREDGSDVGRVLMELFDILDTREANRQRTVRAELLQFPYINGGLFAGHIRTPVFDAETRELLLSAARFNWTGVSPAIFGSLFQSVMDSEERRDKGAHYTSESNILKVIQPLFMDDLRAEFDRIRGRRTDRRVLLEAFQIKLSSLTFFDPACGCGNFLVVAYRELRRLELEVLEILRDRTGSIDGQSVRQTVLDIAAISRVTVEQFYGIELEEFPARIAEVALWMADHLANNELSLAFGQSYARIPLRESPHILNDDALATEWNDHLPADRCSFIMGNPPFIGKKEQTPEQKLQVRASFPNTKGAGELDYVSCWFQRAGQYLELNPSVAVGFVATNSITQGEQVAPLWSNLIGRLKLKIEFCHRTFEWTSEGRGAAHVHVVILGLVRGEPRRARRIFDYASVKSAPTEIEAKNINPYLIDYKDIYVSKSRQPLSPRPLIQKGSEATDFGFLTVQPEDRQALLSAPGFDPSWLRPFWGGNEAIKGLDRYCLWLVGADPAKLAACEPVMERLEAVKKLRKKSGKVRTKSLANYASLFGENRQPKERYIFVPKVSSQRRDYVPITYVDPNIIVSGSAQSIDGGSKFTFGIIMSAIHIAWMKTVGGRTKSDYQYTNDLVYNTFPWPSASPSRVAAIELLVDDILDARDEWPLATLSILYDPRTMPAKLFKAHEALDRAVDKLFRQEPFKTERERVEHLFGLYERLAVPLSEDGPKQNRRVARRRAPTATIE
jgi:hypothetical protein